MSSPGSSMQRSQFITLKHSCRASSACIDQTFRLRLIVHGCLTIALYVGTRCIRVWSEGCMHPQVSIQQIKNLIYSCCRVYILFEVGQGFHNRNMVKISIYYYKRARVFCLKTSSNCGSCHMHSALELMEEHKQLQQWHVITRGADGMVLIPPLTAQCLVCRCRPLLLHVLDCTIGS